MCGPGAGCQRRIFHCRTRSRAQSSKRSRPSTTSKGSPDRLTYIVSSYLGSAATRTPRLKKNKRRTLKWRKQMRQIKNRLQKYAVIKKTAKKTRATGCDSPCAGKLNSKQASPPQKMQKKMRFGIFRSLVLIPGHRGRCSYCQPVLTSSPSLSLSDHVQDYCRPRPRGSVCRCLHR
jgi:hypothetical protein